MKRVLMLIPMLILLCHYSVATSESQAIILPDVVYESLYATSTEDIPSILEDYLDEIEGEKVEVWESSFEFFNGKIEENQVAYVCYEMFVFKDEVGVLIYIDILQPFGQTVEESQAYIDTVNYFQLKYGRATGSSTDEIKEMRIKEYGRDILRWTDTENNFNISIIYADGNISEGRSPIIEFALEHRHPE